MLVVFDEFEVRVEGDERYEVFVFNLWCVVLCVLNEFYVKFVEVKVDV